MLHGKVNSFLNQWNQAAEPLEKSGCPLLVAAVLQVWWPILLKPFGKRRMERGIVHRQQMTQFLPEIPELVMHRGHIHTPLGSPLRMVALLPVDPFAGRSARSIQCTVTSGKPTANQRVLNSCGETGFPHVRVFEITNQEGTVSKSSTVIDRGAYLARQGSR